MTQPIIAPSSLEQQLELSLQIAQGRIRVVAKEELPDECSLHQIHAQLSRACRIANGEELPPRHVS